MQGSENGRVVTIETVKHQREKIQYSGTSSVNCMRPLGSGSGCVDNIPPCLTPWSTGKLSLSSPNHSTRVVRPLCISFIKVHRIGCICLSKSLSSKILCYTTSKADCSSIIPILRLVLFGILSHLDLEIIKLDIYGVNPVIKFYLFIQYNRWNIPCNRLIFCSPVKR